MGSEEYLHQEAVNYLFQNLSLFEYDIKQYWLFHLHGALDVKTLYIDTNV